MRCSMRSYAGSEPDAVALSACEHLGTFTGKNEIQFLAASLSLSLLSLSFFLFPFCGTLKITNCFSVVHIL